MARWDASSSIYVKKQTHSARKTCRMNVNSEEITNFANKVCRMCFQGLFPFQRMWCNYRENGLAKCWPDCWPKWVITLILKVGWRLILLRKWIYLQKEQISCRKTNILAKYYETSTCRTCRMHENCSSNVDQSKRKS